MAYPASFLADITRHFGVCGKCMRTAFVAALGASALALSLRWIAGETITTMIVAGVASGFVLLWLVHLAAYAARTVAPVQASESQPQQQAAALTRRQIIPAFARAFGMIALATAFPAAAFAQDRMHQCITCCNQNLLKCGTGGDCNTNFQNCVNSCNSQGETPAVWRCW